MSNEGKTLHSGLSSPSHTQLFTLSRNYHQQTPQLTYLLGLTTPFNYRRLFKYNSPS